MCLAGVSTSSTTGPANKSASLFEEEKMKDLLTSRKFWAACAGVLVVIVTALLPNFPQMEHQIADLAYLVCAYILGTSLEGGFTDAGQKLAGLLRSRKLWASLAGLLTLVLRAALPDFPLDDSQLNALILTLSAYILGTGAQDGINRLNTAQRGES
jgi:hypothetical protein